MRGFVLTLDAVVGLQAMIFVLLFLLAPQSPANDILLDVQLHQQASDLLTIASIQGWLEEGAARNNWQPLNEGFKKLNVENVCIIQRDEKCAENLDWVCEKWKAGYYSDKTKGVEFGEVILCVPSS